MLWIQEQSGLTQEKWQVAFTTQWAAALAHFLIIFVLTRSQELNWSILYTKQMLYLWTATQLNLASEYSCLLPPPFPFCFCTFTIYCLVFIPDIVYIFLTLAYIYHHPTIGFSESFPWNHWLASDSIRASTYFSAAKCCKIWSTLVITQISSSIQDYCLAAKFPLTSVC